jgi:hypothetical protein
MNSSTFVSVAQIGAAREAALSQREGRIGGEGGGCEFAGLVAGPGSGSDHGRIIGRKSQRRKGDAQASAGGFGTESGTEFSVGGHSAGDENAARAQGFGGCEGLLHQITDHCVLEAGDEVKGLLRTEGESIFFRLRRVG